MSDENMAGRWTAAVVVSILTILMVFLWDRVGVGSKIEDNTIKVTLLQEQLKLLNTIRETQIKDEGIIQQNTHDIEDLKKRLDTIRGH